MAEAQPLVGAHPPPIDCDCVLAFAFEEPEETAQPKSPNQPVGSNPKDLKWKKAMKNFCHIFKVSKKAVRGDEASSVLQDFLNEFKPGRDVKFAAFSNFVTGWILLRLKDDDLHLEVKDYNSTYESVKFIEITASEEALKTEARRVSYKLQLKASREDDKSFQLVPPYCAFPPAPNVEPERQFKHYNKSLFCNIDRIRLIASMLDDICERHELQSQGILLAELYCSEKHGKEGCGGEEDCSEDHSVEEKVEATYSDSEVLSLKQRRMRYGDQTAMLFRWSSFYLNGLKFPAILGCVVWLVANIMALVIDTPKKEDPSNVIDEAALTVVVFGVFLSLYSSFIDALWRRKENKIAWKWGTIELNTIEAQRPQFRGKWKRDRVTGHTRKRRETEEVFLLKRAFSFFMTAVFILIDIGFMTVIFEFQNSFTNKSIALRYSGNALMCALEQGMSSLYKLVSERLVDWENIEFESQYYNSLCVKRFLFEFINQYGPLLYIAFLQLWTQENCSYTGECVLQLNQQVITQFVVFIGIKAVKLLSLRVSRWIKRQETLDLYSKEYSMTLEQARKNMTPIEYKFLFDIEQESTMEDHMDFVLLYGLVLLFSSTAPYSAMYMLVTMWIYNHWSQALEKFMKRLFPHPAQGVGVWNTIILCFSIMAAFTNPAIAIFTANVFRFDSLSHKWVTFLGFSIGLILCKALVNLALPKMPKDVEWGLAWGNRMVQERLGNQDGESKRSLSATSTVLEYTSINS